MTAPPDCHRNRPQNVTEIDAAVPNDLDVHLILDNYASSASWIDLVERWFWFESSPGRGANLLAQVRLSSVRCSESLLQEKEAALQQEVAELGGATSCPPRARRTPRATVRRSRC